MNETRRHSACPSRPAATLEKPVVTCSLFGGSFAGRAGFSDERLRAWRGVGWGAVSVWLFLRPSPGPGPPACRPHASWRLRLGLQLRGWRCLVGLTAACSVEPGRGAGGRCLLHGCPLVPSVSWTPTCEGCGWRATLLCCVLSIPSPCPTSLVTSRLPTCAEGPFFSVGSACLVLGHY